MFTPKTEKILYYIVATSHGEYPAVPRKTEREARKDLPVCKKYKPDEEWITFHIVEVKQDGNEWQELKGATFIARETLMKNVRERYELTLEEEQLKLGGIA